MAYSTTGGLSVAFLRLTFITVERHVNERRFVAVVTLSVTSVTTFIAVVNANNDPENLNVFQTCTGRSAQFWVRFKIYRQCTSSALVTEINVSYGQAN